MKTVGITAWRGCIAAGSDVRPTWAMRSGIAIPRCFLLPERATTGTSSRTSSSLIAHPASLAARRPAAAQFQRTMGGIWYVTPNDVNTLHAWMIAGFILLTILFDAILHAIHHHLHHREIDARLASEDSGHGHGHGHGGGHGPGADHGHGRRRRRRRPRRPGGGHDHGRLRRRIPHSASGGDGEAAHQHLRPVQGGDDHPRLPRHPRVGLQPGAALRVRDRATGSALGDEDRPHLLRLRRERLPAAAAAATGATPAAAATAPHGLLAESEEKSSGSGEDSSAGSSTGSSSGSDGVGLIDRCWRGMPHDMNIMLHELEEAASPSSSA